MGELFREGKDRDAAEAQFLQIFEEHASAKKEKLIFLFVKFFKQEYDKCKRIINVGVVHVRGAVKDGSDMVRFLESAQGKISPEIEAESLGKLLGIFLGTMEYYVPRVDTSFILYAPERHLADVLLTFANDVASLLRTLNKKIKPRFIRNRVIVIAKKHAGQLTPQTRQLYAQIAAAFA